VGRRRERSALGVTGERKQADTQAGFHPHPLFFLIQTSAEHIGFQLGSVSMTLVSLLWTVLFSMCLGKEGFGLYL